MTRELRRVAAAIALGVLAALGVATPVFADPAGPTDYRSEIVSVDPATPTIDVGVIGGDAFLELTAVPGTTVVVLGYQGEDYLRFEPEGAVLENRNSPSTYTNTDRYGGGDIPTNATPDAEPDWVQVGSDHTWAWHDHRIHWMQRTPPLGRSAGDQILEAVVPIVVDGEDVDLTVISVWQPSASTVPVWLGGIAGLAVVAGLWLLRGRRGRALVLVPPALAALVAGTWQFRSLPSSTDPPIVWWLLPVIAAVCVAVAVVADLGGHSFVARAAGVLVGVELAIWGWVKRDGLFAALVPTDAPGWFDRLAVAAALVGGVGTVAVVLWELFVTERPAGSGVSGSRVPTG